MAGVSKGAVGELLSARFLREKGYEVLTSNFRCRLGEVDIIAQKAPYIVFVEVKTRREDALFAPREAVTAAKRSRLIKTAGVYLSRFPTGLQPRFDVVEVVTDPADDTRVLEINHIMGAYEAGDLHEAF